MNIDIFTFLSQIINFLVLLFILNKLAYKPIMKKMKERNIQIKNTIDDAENKLKEAEAMRDKYDKELNSIDNYKKEQIELIDSELINYKITELEAIKQDFVEQKESFLKQLESEKEIIIDELLKKFCSNIEGLLNEMFVSISDSSLNSIVLNKFLSDIKNISNDNIQKINKSETKIIDFVSCFELTNEEKTLVKNTFRMKGIVFENVNFVVDKNILLGNRISSNGVIINSNIKNIIDSFIINLKTIL